MTRGTATAILLSWLVRLVPLETLAGERFSSVGFEVGGRTDVRMEGIGKA